MGWRALLQPAGGWAEGGGRRRQVAAPKGATRLPDAGGFLFLDPHAFTL